MELLDADGTRVGGTVEDVNEDGVLVVLDDGLTFRGKRSLLVPHDELGDVVASHNGVETGLAAEETAPGELPALPEDYDYSQTDLTEKPEGEDAGEAGAEMTERGRITLSEDEAGKFVAEMEANAGVAPDVELTIENWDALFGDDGMVSTPIGNVKMGENQFAKLMRRGRNSKLGMVKPTLTTPDVIVEDGSSAKEGSETERASSYLFIKSFKKGDGSRYYYFTSISVSKDGKEVVVSNQEKSRNRIVRLLTNGSVIWRAPKDAAVSSVEKQGLDYAHPEKTEDGAKGSGLTPQSTPPFGKGTETSVPVQAEGTESSVNGAVSAIPVKEVKTRKGVKRVKMYHEAPVSATVADIVGDGELDTAEAAGLIDAYAESSAKKAEDVAGKKPAPVADADAYKEALRNWREEVKAAEAEAAYWQEVKAEYERITRTAEEEAVEEQAEETIATREGVLSSYLGGRGGILITPESFDRETGLRAADRKKLVGYLARAENGGVSMERASEMLWELMGADERALFGDQPAVRDALIDLFSRGNPRTVAKEAREAVDAMSPAHYEEGAREAYYEEAYHMGYEEYTAYEEQLLPEVIRLYHGIDENALWAMFAEAHEAMDGQRQANANGNERQTGNHEGIGENEATARGHGVLRGEGAGEERGVSVGPHTPGEAGTGLPGGNQEKTLHGGAQAGGEGSGIGNALSLLDAVRTLYSKGKEVASKLFSMKFFDVAQTPKFMQELGLRGDKFTIKYGVIARHAGKDGSHTLTERDWEQLPQALQNPFAISKLNDKKDAYRIYTSLQTEGGEFVVVGADVKNAGRDIEVNAISTVFGRRNNANLSQNEEVIYRSNEITPEQSALLKRPNFAQYPTEQELSSAGKGTETHPDLQGNGEKIFSQAELQEHLTFGKGSGKVIRGQFLNQGWSKAHGKSRIENGMLIPGKTNKEDQRSYTWWNKDKPFSMGVGGKPFDMFFVMEESDVNGIIRVRDQSNPIGQWSGKSGFVTVNEMVTEEPVDLTKAEIYIKNEDGTYRKGTLEEVNALSTPSLQSRVEEAEGETNPNPTPAQAEAGNYKKGKVTVGDFDLSIENPAGSVRRGVDADGKEWETKMANTYGYILGTEGVDGDHIDVFLSGNMDEWNGRRVFVVDQTRPDGSFDEHKVMLGFNSAEEAEAAYFANYSADWRGTHPGIRITGVNVEDFKKWVQSSHRKTKPFAEYSAVKGAVSKTGTAEQAETPKPHELPKRLENAYAGGNEEEVAEAERAIRDFISGTKDYKDVFATYFRAKENARGIRDKENASRRANEFIAQCCKDALKDAGFAPNVLYNGKARADYAATATDAAALDLLSADTSTDVVGAVVRNPHTQEETLQAIAERYGNNGLDFEAKQALERRKEAKAKQAEAEEDTKRAENVPVQEGGKPYTIAPASYTTNRGKVLDMQLVKFGRELSKDETRNAKALAKGLKGWYDKEKGGFMMRSTEDAQKLADAVMDESGETLADAAPVSIPDLRQVEAAPAKGEGVIEKAERITKELEARQAPLEQPKNSGQFGLVSDERMEELKKRLRNKLRGQLNSGIDPETLAIGMELAAGHIDRGIKKFADFAKVMVEDLGDAIRPYLKAFYNGARDLPEVVESGLSEEMTPFDEVRTFDVANFDKGHTDVFAKAEAIVAEQGHQEEAEQAKKEIVNKRNTTRRTENEHRSAKERMEEFAAMAERGESPYTVTPDVEKQLAENRGNAKKKSEGNKKSPTTELVRQDSTTFISSQPSDDAKVQQISENLAQLSEKYRGKRDKSGIYTDFALAVGATRTGDGASRYASIHLKDGSSAVIRISNHNANAQTYAERGELTNNISIVFKTSRSRNSFKSHPDVELTEYVYTTEAIRNDGILLSQVAESLRQMIETGEYVDLSGKAIVNRSQDQPSAPRNPNKNEQRSINPEQPVGDLFSGLLEEPIGNNEKKTDEQTGRAGGSTQRPRREDRLNTDELSDEKPQRRARTDNERLDPDLQGRRDDRRGNQSVPGGNEPILSGTERPAGRLSRLEEPKNTRNNRAERGVDYAPKGEDARIAANMAAIRLSKELLAKGEEATPEQMAVLRKFSGWGGLGKAFSNEATANELRELLGEQGYQDAVDSRRSAYYTPAYVIDALWDIARALGFKGGNILEGSAGIGNILGLMPEALSDRSNIHAVEIDSTTGGILSLLYPDAKVDIQGFQEAKVRNGSIDLAITNVPFIAGQEVFDKTGDKDLSAKFKIADFCIAKNIRKLREGGIGIFITSSGTLDDSARLRAWITNEGNADVVGAFRMHNKTFGGTGATSDIIVVRKRVNGKVSPNAIDVADVTGIRVAEYDTGETRKVKGEEVPVVKRMGMEYNKYYAEHPENMAGEMQFNFERGETWQPTSRALFPSKDKPQEEMLSAWADRFSRMEAEAEAATSIEDAATRINEQLGEGVKEGSMVLNSQGQLCIARMGEAVPILSPQAGKGKKQRTDEERLDLFQNKKVKGHTKAACFKAYAEIKAALSAVLEYQSAHEDNAGLEPLLEELNRAFDAFTGTYGNLHKNPAIAFLRNDVDFSNILALEDYSEKGDKEGNKVVKVGKTDVFKHRVVETEKEPRPETLKDGIIASLYKSGVVDVDYIAQALGQPAGEIRREIVESGLGFENPATGAMEVSYQYLSGNVREKLRIARENNEDGRYDANISALEKVLPITIPAHLVEFTFGSSWIAPKLYEDFIEERTGLKVELANVGGTWAMQTPYYTLGEKNRSMAVVSELCGKTIMGHELMEAALTNRTITVSKTIKHWDGTTETITDREATTACANKVDEIRSDFKDWARSRMQEDPEMSARMEQMYNERFNNYVPESIDDEFVPEHFGGAVTTLGGKPFKLYKHQAKAVVRATTHAVMLAHEVGTGKTYTLITAAMEMRRLGTARKPMIVVQNATVGQFVASAKEIYPNAKVLTIEEADRTAEGRKNFYAKIKYNDWDMIVVPQSVFERIPDSEERQMAYIKSVIEEKMNVLALMKEHDSNGRNPIVRQAEKEIADKEEELAKIAEAMEAKRNKRDGKREATTRQNAEVKALKMLDREVDDVENFDDMGIDALLVDEAHEYKHLGFATAMQRGVKGVDPSFSKKSQGVFLKTQSVLERNHGRNVVFATGTPISNTAAEIWTFMRYLMPADTMKEYGIYYFDDFVRNFGNISQMVEFKTDGKFAEVNRFAGYVNLPELVRIWSSVADTVLTREAEGVKNKVPETEKDAEARKGMTAEEAERDRVVSSGRAEDIYLPQTRALRSVMKYVKAELKRFDEMTGKEKKENSHIPLTMYGIAKAAAVDARLVVNDAEDDPNSKTNAAVRETLRSLEDSKKYKGTVAIFADNYQNNRSGFNLYEDIRAKLIDAGVPAEQVVIIKPGMTVKKKLDIFEKVNAGEIRVVMGSTFTLGTGVNIQERLHTAIHVDAPNRPMDYTQRNGRILRQGNLHKDMGIPVRILRFGVEDSLDVTAYQRLKTKGAIADSIMNGKKMIQNSMENRVLEEEEDVFGDMTAQLSGSQYAVLKNQAEREVRSLTSKQKQHDIDQIYLHEAIPKEKGFIAGAERRIGIETANLETIGKHFPNGKADRITVGKLSFGSVDEMGDFFKQQNAKMEDLVEQVENGAGEANSTLTVRVNGLDFVVNTHVGRKLFENGQQGLGFETERRVTFSCDALGLKDVSVKGNRLKGVMTEIAENIATGANSRRLLSDARHSLRAHSTQLSQMEARYGKEFPFKEELEAAKERFIEYEAKMRKELEEKEAKYAEMDAGVEASKDVEYTPEDEEEQENENSYREVRDEDTLANAMSDPQSIRAAAEKLAEELHTPIRIIEEVNEIEHEDASRQERMRSSKGWYNNSTGEVVIVLPNNIDVEDAAATVFHEVVAHKGLKELIGAENEMKFYDEVYQHCKADVRKAIDKLAPKYGYDFGEATKEYMGSLAEKGFEDFTPGERSIWQWFKQEVLDAINKFLETMKLPKWVKLGDNELRYMLWRSKQNLERGKMDPVQVAADIVKRDELGLDDTLSYSDNKKGFKRNRAARLDKSSKGQIATVVSREAVAKIVDNLQTLAREYEKYPHRVAGFITNVAAAMNMDRDGSSNYANIELPSGLVLTVRNSNHNAKVPLFDKLGETDVVSIVISKYPNKGLQGTGEANVEEFYYKASSLDDENGASLPVIIRDIANSLRTGVYSNTARANYVNSTYTDANGERKTRIETSEQYAKRKRNEEEELSFRDGDPEVHERARARDRYERRVRSGLYQSQEAFLDSMLGLKEFTDAVLRAEGKRMYIEDVDGFENAYLGENRLSSVNQAEADLAAHTLFDALYKEVSALARNEDERAVLVDYMMAKHGLERNEYMAQRDAERSLADSVEKKALDAAEEAYQADPADPLLEDARDAAKQAYDDALEAAFFKFRNKDYAGLTALTGTGNVADAEAEARQMVADYEGRGVYKDGQIKHRQCPFHYPPSACLWTSLSDIVCRLWFFKRGEIKKRNRQGMACSA